MENSHPSLIRSLKGPEKFSGESQTWESVNKFWSNRNKGTKKSRKGSTWVAVFVLHID
jgi:hypothetical protein